MGTNFFDRKRIIYELMVGDWNLIDFPVAESEIVENEYAEGKLCEQLYQEVSDAAQRLYDRLGRDEDRDVVTIIMNLLKIGEIQGLKMYDYGAYFASEK